MSSTARFLSKVRNALREAAPARGTRLLVACSGGPDSTALLAALHETGDRYGLDLLPAHVDHGIRAVAERDAETEAAESCARAIGRGLIRLSIEPGRLQEIARAGHRSLEEAAREARMAQLSEAAAVNGCALIALGHTADDQIETLVMRFFQGSGAAGLAGMRTLAGRLLRPLLRCTRAEVLAFVGEHGLAFQTDSSNSDTRFLRNSVRAELLPTIRRVFPGCTTALEAMARKMSDLAELVAAETDRRCPWSEDREHEWSADASAFFSMPPALRLASLYTVLDNVSPGRIRIPFRRLEALLRGLRVGRDADISAGGLRVTVHGGRIAVSRHIVCPAKTGYFTVLAELAGGTVQAGPWRLTVAALGDSPQEESSSASAARVLVRPPVVLRSRRRGDRMRTAAGTTSLKKLLNKWGVPLEARDDVAVLADAQGVAAAIAMPWGVRVAERQRAAGCAPLAIISVEKRRI